MTPQPELSTRHSQWSFATPCCQGGLLDAPTQAEHAGSIPVLGSELMQVIPEGGGPVKTNLCVVLVRSASFLVLAGRVEVGVGVKARAEPDRVAAVGP